MATSTGVVLPDHLAEDQMMTRLGQVLSAEAAVDFGERMRLSMERRGLDLPNPSVAAAQWLPELSLTFDGGARRGVGVRDLEALADTLDVDPEDLDLDVVESEREWRNDLVQSDWRAMVRLTWRPAPREVASRRSQVESARRATVQERRRVSRRAARMLAGYLAAERRLILHPPRTVRSAVRRILQAQTKRALLEGMLDQEIP